MHDESPRSRERVFDAPMPEDPQARAAGNAAAKASLSHGVNENVSSSPVSPPPRIRFDDADGQVVRRYRPDGPFEATLKFLGRVADAPSNDLIQGQQLTFLTLDFPNADIAREHIEQIEHALALLNDLLGRAHSARHEDVPAAASCKHHVIIERFGRVLAQQATCDRCLTVLVRDVAAWLDEYDYGHLTDGPHVVDKATAAAIIEEAANRGR